MEQPEGYNDVQGSALKLKKSLYDLKQSGREWYMKLHKYLTDISFIRSTQNLSFYKQILFILVYADNLLIFGVTLQSVLALKEQLKQVSSVKRGAPA